MCKCKVAEPADIASEKHETSSHTVQAKIDDIADKLAMVEMGETWCGVLYFSRRQRCIDRVSRAGGVRVHSLPHLSHTVPHLTLNSMNFRVDHCVLNVLATCDANLTPLNSPHSHRHRPAHSTIMQYRSNQSRHSTLTMLHLRNTIRI